ncbi:MAG: ATP-binding protein, partial [Candidatus Paceibacterota bacterium]
MLIFNAVKWKNLLSTGNQFIELDFIKSKNVLMVGENGSGKSTVLDALCFGLFGKAFRNINKPTLVNSINQKDCVVVVNFTYGSQNYEIIRGIKPNIFEIWCNGILVNQDSSTRDYQDYLEKYILKMNYKSFTQIVILGSASFTPFMQLSAADRREIIEDLLDIQIFSRMNVVTKDKLQINKEEGERCRYDIKLWDEKSKFILKTLDSLKQNNKMKLELLVKEKDDIIDDKKKLELKIFGLNEEKETKVSEYIGIHELRNKHKNFVGLQNKIENNLSIHRKNVDFYHENDNCPTCLQIIDKTFKTSIITKTTKKVEELSNGLSDLETKINEIVENINKLDSVGKSIEDIEWNIGKNVVTLEYYNKSISKLDKDISLLSEADNIIEENTQEYNKIQIEKNVSETKLEEILTERQYFEMILNLLKDGGIKTKIIKQYLPIINKQINKYLAALDFFVNFTIDENFNEIIKSRFRDEFSYENFSEGEKMRIDLALLFTWRIVAKMKNSINTNLLILDEVFDSSLDNNGTDEFMKILNTLTNNMNVFIISHKGDQLFDKFEKII